MKRTLIAAALALAAGAAQAATTELVIYKGANFHGPGDTIKGEVANLENGFGREVSSMVVRGGAWQVCTGDHFTGRCRVIDEGEYPTLGWLNDRIVSVKFLGNNPDLARYDNWDKREARNERRYDSRDNRYDNRDSYRQGDGDARNGNGDRARDDRYWSTLPR